MFITRPVNISRISHTQLAPSGCFTTIPDTISSNLDYLYSVVASGRDLTFVLVYLLMEISEQLSLPIQFFAKQIACCLLLNPFSKVREDQRIGMLPFC